MARQYCGLLGKPDNCQVAVSALGGQRRGQPARGLSAVPAGELGARIRRRRRAAGVPDDLAFQPKWQIALAQIRAAAGGRRAARAWCVADAGYGDDTEFREALTAAGLPYVVGVKGDDHRLAARATRRCPRSRGGAVRAARRSGSRRTPRHQPVSLKSLAAELPAAAWQTVTWREGTRGVMRSRFARLRVRPAHRDEQRSEPRAEEWLLIEWPRGESEPTKYWLSTLPETMLDPDLVRLAKLRWRIERDYQELKDELGPGSLRGARLAGLPSSRRALYRRVCLPRGRARDSFPPAPLAFLRPARLPKGFKPRGAPGAA